MTTADDERPSTVLPLGRRGPAFVAVVTVLATLAAVGAGVLAAALAIQLVVDEPMPGDGGRPGAVALALGVAALAYLLATWAWRGWQTALVACRRSGRATVDRDLLIVEAPGVLREPLVIHRSWVSDVEHVRTADQTATTFTMVTVSHACVIRLGRPIGIPSAIRSPGFRQDGATLPDPAKEVRDLVLDLRDRAAGAAALARWAARRATTEPPDPLAPVPVDRRPRRRRLVAWAVFAASLASLFFTVPY
ncbi:MAG TPA: hypothetical protein VNS19_18790 [Acidimicrobiales bacterium]|nr:hypothetical protein [Acidimicrobiales bacterium]